MYCVYMAGTHISVMWIRRNASPIDSTVACEYRLFFEFYHVAIGQQRGINGYGMVSRCDRLPSLRVILLIMLAIPLACFAPCIHAPDRRDMYGSLAWS